MASLRYDASAKALYVRVRRGRIARTEPLNDSVFIDLDQRGKLVGIEVILPKDIPVEIVEKITAR